jgi:hypothetical protein
MFAGLAAAALGLAAPAHADETVDVCPDGFSGIATGMTSCPFAETARQVWYNHGGANPIQVISPVTGEMYTLNCDPEHVIHLNNSGRRSMRCAARAALTPCCGSGKANHPPGGGGRGLA